MTEISAAREQLLTLLVENSFLFSDTKEFTLASGKKSNYYINCKKTTLNPEAGVLIGEIFFHTLANVDVDAIGGITLGADPICYATSLISFLKGKKIKQFIVRKEPKGHGLKKWIEGDINENDRVVIVEDVVTTGGSTINAINRAEEAKLKIIKVMALVDRDEGGREKIRERGFLLEPVFTRSDLIQKYRELH